MSEKPKLTTPIGIATILTPDGTPVTNDGAEAFLRRMVATETLGLHDNPPENCLVIIQAGSPTFGINHEPGFRVVYQPASDDAIENFARGEADEGPAERVRTSILRQHDKPPFQVVVICEKTHIGLTLLGIADHLIPRETSDFEPMIQALGNWTDWMIPAKPWDGALWKPGMAENKPIPFSVDPPG